MSIADQLRAAVRSEVERRLGAVRDDVVADAKQTAPRDSGALADAIVADDWTLSGTRYTTTVRVPVQYASWVEEGTGVYGPYGQRIYPVRAKALVFFWKRGPNGPGVYAYRSVAGQPGQRYFSAPMPDRYRRALTRSFG